MTPCNNCDTYGNPSIDIGPTLFFAILSASTLPKYKSWVSFKNSGYLQHDRHKNFENWFRNSGEIWGQRWDPFYYYKEAKNNFGVTGGNFDFNYLHYL